jgi:hypothetical protein
MGSKQPLDSQQSPSPLRKKRIRRKPRVQIEPEAPVPTNQKSKSPGGRGAMVMAFGTELCPALTWYYRSHEGLSLHGRLSPLFMYPIEVLAACSQFRFERGTLQGSGWNILKVAPPHKVPGMSNHELHTLWAEDFRLVLAKLAKADPKDSRVRRYRRNLEVLEFMRATWDAVLLGYQVERAVHLTRYGVYSPLSSRRLQGLERFKSELVYHPLQAAQRAKACAQACRVWHFGGPLPKGRLLVFQEKRIALLASYVARSLPPAPPDPAGLQALVARLTSPPPPEPTYWRPFLKRYFDRFPPSRKVDLYTMPSANAALGYPRSHGGHSTGVQHLVLLGYALKRVRGSFDHPTIGDDDQTGGYLELLSDGLHPSSQLHPDRVDAAALFRQPWDELEKSLPGAGRYLQNYLQVGVHYVLENLKHVPILPISAEERGLKTRFPTCSLTAVNLVQQILRRVIDSSMVVDPRFSEALGGNRGIDLRGEVGPWESQDCTAATDLHPEWLTRAVYEELADRCPQLSPYRKYYTLLFGPKRILTGLPVEFVPETLFRCYPRAPLLDDRFVPNVRGDPEYGHGSIILQMWNDWLNFLNTRDGVLTSTGQMMGDPTSFPPLMLVSLCSAEQVLEVIPYSPMESKRRHRGLKRHEPVLKGVGDDALLPRWTLARRKLYHVKLAELAAVVSKPKSFWHALYGLIAEIPTQSGWEVPFWPLSVLAAPPGGSKGHVTWFSQCESFGGDPTRPTKRIPKFFWKLSPYYYTWMLARRLGLPVGAPVSYGGLGLPIQPAVSLTHHTQWLSYMSTRPLEELIVGLGIGPLGSSQKSLLDPAASGWLKEVLLARDQWSREGLELLSPCALDDTAGSRVSIKEAFELAVGRLRSVEFYFRAPPELNEHRAPSVRRAASRFSWRVSRANHPWGGHASFQRTRQDLERKLQLFFSTSGGFLPDPWARAPGLYGLETSGIVKRRWKAPWLHGLG